MVCYEIAAVHNWILDFTLLIEREYFLSRPILISLGSDVGKGI